MILNDPSGPKVYRLRPGTVTDSYGDPVESWDTPDRKRLSGAVVQAKSVDEDEAPTGTSRNDERILGAPRRLDLRAEDRIEYEGEVWRVHGDPIVRRTYAMGVYTSAELRRRESS